MLLRRSSAVLTLCAGAFCAGHAAAQAPAPYGAPPTYGTPPATYGAQPGYGPPQGYGAPGAYPSTAPPGSWSPSAPPAYPSTPYAAPVPAGASDSEVGALYAVSVGYGIGTGIWLDAELGVDDPGLQFLPPAILGVAAPVGVFFLNRPRMPRGMPAAIATGMFIGAGEGLGLAGYQFAHAQSGDEPSFTAVTRSVFLGSTAGTVVGYIAAVTMEPSPKTSVLMASSVTWGTVVGSMWGYGSSTSGTDWSTSNDTAALGGLIGFNAGLVGAAALSTVWVPSYESLSWMWIGFGAGLAISLPVYVFYAGGDHDARRGLIVQGTLGTLGLVAGAVFTIDAHDFGLNEHRSEEVASKPSKQPAFQITGGGIMPVRSGLGFQVSGIIF